MIAPAPADAPLLPAPLRRPAGLAVGVALAVFVVLAVRYAGTDESGRADRLIDSMVDANTSSQPWLLERVMAFGSPPAVVIAAIGMAVACALVGRRRLAVLAVVGPGLTGLATTLLKPAIDRTIGGGLAFPSGHTGGATSLGIVAALLFIGLLRPSPSAALALLAGGALIAGGTVGGAMIASNAHYPTDTVGGFCAAVVLVLVSAGVIDRVAEHSMAGAGPIRG